MELAHCRDLRRAETAPKAAGQIIGDSSDYLLAVTRAFFSALFMLHNTPTNFPIRRRHQRVHHTRRCPPRRVQQFDHSDQHFVVVSKLRLVCFPASRFAARFAHGNILCWLIITGLEMTWRAIRLVLGQRDETPFDCMAASVASRLCAPAAPASTLTRPPPPGIFAFRISSRESVVSG